jgi:ABC-type multidrug transport system ATPase subunit
MLALNCNTHYNYSLGAVYYVGKSTLLDLIADRKNVGTWTGKILVNQTPRSRHFNRISAYVLQDNCHIPVLTVEETIAYAAWTRLPQGTTPETARRRVTELLDMMGMAEKRNSIVGDLSGGYVKRLSIAVEIISLPYILFLDEPTSGLDSSTAYDVMNVVRSLSRRGRNCVTTIHQPSPEVFALFDRLVLLCAGRIVYSGLVKDACGYFTSPALNYPSRPRQNPAEYIIDIAGGKILPLNKSTIDKDGVVTQTVSTARSDLELQALFITSGLMTPPAPMTTSAPLVFPFVRVGYAAKVNQVSMLLHRGFRKSYRDRTVLIYSLAKNLWLGILIGLVFRGVNDKLEEPFYEADGQQTPATTEFAGLLYFLLVYIWLSNGQIIPVCVDTSKLYSRELSSFAYVPIAFWVSVILIELPFMLFFHTLFTTLVYLMCGFPHSFSYYCFFWLLLALANLFAMVFAQFLAFGTGSSLLAFAIYPVVFYVLGMFSSYTIRIHNLAPGLRWVSDATFVRWAYQGLMVLEFDQYGSGGDSLLGDYSFDGATKEDCVYVLLGNIAAAAVLLYLSLRKPAKKIIYLDFDSDVEASALSYNLESSLVDDVVCSSGNGRMTDIGGNSSSSRGSVARQTHPRLSMVGIRESISGALLLSEGVLAAVAESLELVDPEPHGYRDVGGGAEDKFLEAGPAEAPLSLSLSPARTEPSLGSITDDSAGADADGTAAATTTTTTTAAAAAAASAADGDSMESGPDMRGSISAGTSLVISCQNVGMILPSTRPREKNATLLYNVNGCVRPRQLCAVMGPSGSGKTALLDIIYGNHLGRAAMQGEVQFNNIARNARMQRRLAFVSSNDVHIPVLTVRETLMYAATLRMQFTLPMEKKQKQVEEVIQMLGLTKSANTVVGNHLIRGISGGQKRRLSIGVEIIHYPDALMIDECTTGLDSATSDEVVGYVRRLCDQNRTILLSIHQPSPIAFKLFDLLLLLSEGRVFYFGPADKAVQFFTDSPFKFAMAEHMNPGDFVVSIAGRTMPDGKGELPSSRAVNLYYSHSQADLDMLTLMDDCADSVPVEERRFELLSVYPTPRGFQIYLLIDRCFTKAKRNRRPIRIGFFRHVLVGLLYGM